MCNCCAWLCPCLFPSTSTSPQESNHSALSQHNNLRHLNPDERDRSRRITTPSLQILNSPFEGAASRIPPPTKRHTYTLSPQGKVPNLLQLPPPPLQSNRDSSSPCFSPSAPTNSPALHPFENRNHRTDSPRQRLPSPLQLPPPPNDTITSPLSPCFSPISPQVHTSHPFPPRQPPLQDAEQQVHVPDLTDE